MDSELVQAVRNEQLYEYRVMCTGKLEKLNLHKSINEIQKEITKLEYEVKHFMDENYTEFNAKLMRDLYLVKKTEQLLEEISVLQGRINDQVSYIKSAFILKEMFITSLLKQNCLPPSYRSR